MRVHWCQHAAHEGLGIIEPWLHANGHHLSCSRLFAGELPPPPPDYDWLILMGGPMNVDEEAQHPWLAPHKAGIRAALDADKRVLGICLGAQLIAAALGAKVTRNRQTEIGWYEVHMDAAAGEHALTRQWPQQFTAFHWHGDTFAIPAGAIAIAHSDACDHQGFIWGTRVAGLQFHPEVTAADVDAWLGANPDLSPGPGVQSAAVMRSGAAYMPRMHACMRQLLAALAAA